MTLSISYHLRLIKLRPDSHLTRRYRCYDEEFMNVEAREKKIVYDALKCHLDEHLGIPVEIIAMPIGIAGNMGKR